MCYLQAQILTQVAVCDVESARMACLVFKQRGCRIVIITLGKMGSVVMGENLIGCHIPSVPVQRVDSTVGSCGAYIVDTVCLVTDLLQTVTLLLHYIATNIALCHSTLLHYIDTDIITMSHCIAIHVTLCHSTLLKCHITSLQTSHIVTLHC